MASAAVHYINPRDNVHAEAFRDFEGDLCDLDLMARLASREAEDVLDAAQSAPISGDDYERATFAITHLQQMISAMKTRYYEQFAAGRR